MSCEPFIVDGDRYHFGVIPTAGQKSSSPAAVICDTYIRQYVTYYLLMRLLVITA